MTGTLPHILVIADEPIVRTLRGNSEALIRLLDRYPADLLTIAQTQGNLQREELRLFCLGYYRWTVPWDRLFFTRLRGLAQVAKIVTYKLSWHRFLGAARRLAPDAIVTLAQNNGWLLAARLARELDVPLHIIVHDGPEHFQLTRPLIGPFMKKEFIAACQQAHSRWSICAELDAHLTEMTGVPGQVMLPLLAADDVIWPPALETAARRDAIYFGGINSASVLTLLQSVGDAMSSSGGNLRVFGGVSPSIQSLPEWEKRSFDFAGSFADRNSFLADCRLKAAFLFLPFPFGETDMDFSFPSKLVDYTLAGLPIVVQAPAASPIGKWCIANPGAVEFVDSPDAGAMVRAVQRILASAEHRQSLSIAALAAGARDFAHEPNWQAFQAALCASGASKQRERPKIGPKTAL